MAIIIDGIPVSGSSGHTTYSRNRYGAYKRNRTKPVNPTSPLQVAMRAAFRAAIDAWTNDLTDVQRAGWVNYANAVPWLNKAGQTVQLQPQAMFARSYMWQIYANQTPEVDAPLINDLGSIDISAFTLLNADPITNTPAVTITAPLLTNSWQVTGGIVSVMLSLGANPSTSFPPRRFALYGRAIIGATPAATVTIVADGSFPWIIQTGQKVWAKVSAWHPDNRLTTTVLTAPILAQDAP